MHSVGLSPTASFLAWPLEQCAPGPELSRLLRPRQGLHAVWQGLLPSAKAVVVQAGACTGMEQPSHGCGGTPLTSGLIPTGANH